MDKENKFKHCKACPLFDQTFVKPEVNCKNGMKDVDVVIFAEAPAAEEAKQGRPLVGKAGKIFREAYEKSGLSELNTIISNVVSCTNIIDGKTNTPPDDSVELCKETWKKLLEYSSPKAILIMGAIPMNVLGIADSGITKLRGGFHKYDGIDVMVTVHPSYVQRNGGIGSDVYNEYLSDFKKVVEFVEFYDSRDIPPIEMLESTEPEEEIVEAEFDTDFKIIKENKAPFTYKLPAWCYSEDYCLVDIQNIREDDVILYIFRDKDGNRVYHRELNKEKYFYIKQDTDQANAPMLTDVSDTYLVISKKKTHLNNCAIYESDVRSELKHAIDYRINRGDVPEAKPKLKKLYFDIEVYNNGLRSFPNPKKATKAINAISFKMNGEEKVNVWITVLPEIQKKRPDIPENANVRFFKSEGEMLESWFEYVSAAAPDLILGWNCVGFDIPTIYNRANKCGANIEKMSPINRVSCNTKKYGEIQIYGTYVCDMLDLYKFLTYSVEESYKLDAIAKKVLGEGKVAYEGSLDGLYENDLSKFIEYSAVDTSLLEELDVALGHVDLRFELMRICSSTWKASETTMGQIDPLCLSYAKNMNVVCRNALEPEDDLESIPGGYVRNPAAGLHGYVIDLDFTSLYPSIICSCNIGPNTYLARVDTEVAFDVVYRRDEVDPDKVVSLTIDPLKKSCKTMQVTFEKLINTIDAKNCITTASGCIYKNHDEEVSFFNRILTHLMKSRKKYKSEMARYEESGDKALAKVYDNIQMAYKILANSLYGVLANNNFRMFNLDMAKSITLTGQESIKFAGHHAGQYLKTGSKTIDSGFMNNYETRDIPYLVYTDTDSIFVDMGEYLVDVGKMEI